MCCHELSFHGSTMEMHEHLKDKHPAAVILSQRYVLKIYPCLTEHAHICFISFVQ